MVSGSGATRCLCYYTSLRGRGTSLPACEAKPRDGGEPLGTPLLAAENLVFLQSEGFT